jgi:hypothetical protein
VDVTHAYHDTNEVGILALTPAGLGVDWAPQIPGRRCGEDMDSAAISLPKAADNDRGRSVDKEV